MKQQEKYRANPYAGRGSSILRLPISWASADKKGANAPILLRSCPALIMQSIITLRTFQSRQCSLQWRESFRMMRPGLRRLSVFVLALTMVLPLGSRAEAGGGHALTVAANCCGANCPPPATHNAQRPNCCAFSRLPFSSCRTTCESNSFRDPMQIPRASWLSKSFPQPTVRAKSSPELWPAPVPLDRLCSRQL